MRLPGPTLTSLLYYTLFPLPRDSLWKFDNPEGEWRGEREGVERPGEHIR